MPTQLQDWMSDPLAGKIVLVGAVIAAILIAIRLLRRTVAGRLQDNNARYQARKALSLFGFLASLAVAFGGFYRVGDRVQLGGIKGDVIDVGILRTTIMEMGQWVQTDQYNGRIVRVANSFVFKEPVFNYSGEFPFLWDEIMLPLKYGSDYRLARELLTRVAQEVVGDYAQAAEQAWEPVTQRFMIERASVQPLVAMTANENWIEFTLRYVVDYKSRRVTKNQLFSRLLEEIDKTDGKVGIAASTLNIKKFAPLEVRLANSPSPVPHAA